MFANKYALIVAVAKYPEKGGWMQISSDRDVSLIKDALLKQGFKPENITVLLDEQATKAGMVKAFSEVKEKLQKDDVFVFHFSGHGQQIQDDNGDEIDGYDEAIIPYDAQVNFSAEYQGENHFRDDLLGEILTGIREKLGEKGNILVILDACHSGTGTRGYAKARGTQKKFEQPGYVPTVKPGEDIAFDEMPASRGASKLSLAPMVIFSGASADELNYEYRDDKGITYGSLSYATEQGIAKAAPELTYRGLFDLVKLEMSVIAPKQTPQIEGDIDRGILGGQAIEQHTYFLAKEWDDDRTIDFRCRSS